MSRGECAAAQRRIEPATQDEIDLFCEQAGVVRPDPNDERAVCSFASWFARWRHERRKDEMNEETNEAHVCRPEQTDGRTATCPSCLAVYVLDEDATADERSCYTDA